MGTKLQKQKVGRPSVITEESVRKLEAALCAGFGVSAACYYSGVSTSTYYEHKALNREFSVKMSKAEEMATFMARQVVLKAIAKGNVKAAQWWLERKARVEFAANKPM